MWTLKGRATGKPKQVPIELGTQIPYLFDEVWVKTSGLQIFWTVTHNNTQVLHYHPAHATRVTEQYACLPFAVYPGAGSPTLFKKC